MYTDKGSEKGKCRNAEMQKCKNVEIQKYKVESRNRKMESRYTRDFMKNVLLATWALRDR